MKYKYKPQASAGDDIIRYPLANVTLKHGRKTLNLDCLVDSGASESLFSFDIAKLLNIDPGKSDPQEYVGIGDIGVTGYRTGIQLRLSGFHQWINLEAGFIGQNDVPLLGHSGFFENFEITFRAARGLFEIKNL